VTTNPLLLRYMPPGTSPPLVIAGILGTLFPDAVSAVDLTPGRHGFWSEQVPIHVVVTFCEHDFRALPYVDQAFDVALFDPPHLADAGTMSIMGRRFGSYPNRDLETIVRQGCREAWRVARLGTIVKVTDHVHGRRFVRMSGWGISELGEPFEVVHHTRAQPLIDPRWGAQLSAYNNGSTFLVWRRDGPVHVRRRPAYQGPSGGVSL
jgi:hypothetical protein